MPSQIEKLREIAKKNPRKIALPEGTEPRVLKAAGIASSLGIAEITLLGEKDKIKEIAAQNSVKLDKIGTLTLETYPKAEELVEEFYNLRKHKGITKDEARSILSNDAVYFGAMLVRRGEADGFVAGASRTTRDVARAAFHCLEIDQAVGVMSSSFVIELRDSDYGDNGLFVFGDCGIVQDPTPVRLAGIAISSSQLYEGLFSASPAEGGQGGSASGGKKRARVALLSYSTKGSAEGESVEKVRKTLELIKQKAPDLLVDGELQLDAAIVPNVARIKAPESAVAGRANVLIFPNLDAGNIACKLVQRLGKARVVGPLFEGLTKPASDLSRGCGVEEIVDAVAATAVRAALC